MRWLPPKPWLAARPGVPVAVHIAVAVLLVVPIAPLLARVVFQPIADASVLVLLIVSLALHFLLSGLGLLFFGPEGSRTGPLATGTLELPGGFTVTAQVLLMIVSAIVLSGLFFLLFERTVVGKALRATAVNRVGARLVGIRPQRTALLAYTFASLLAGLIGVLIAPVTTMPEKTVEAWRNLWFHTGDRVVRDADGAFRFVDRIKDAIRRRGENISSFEVEQVLLSHPGVASCAVYPVQSELAEDEVMAALVPRDGERIDPAELVRFCESRLPYFAVPRYIDVLADLPRTENGKVQKFKLRERGVGPQTWDGRPAKA